MMGATVARSRGRCGMGGGRTRRPLRRLSREWRNFYANVWTNRQRRGIIIFVASMRL